MLSEQEVKKLIDTLLTGLKIEAKLTHSIGKVKLQTLKIKLFYLNN